MSSHLLEQPTIPTLEFHPLTIERWGDFEKLFGPRGAYGGCWCMWWRKDLWGFREAPEGRLHAPKAFEWIFPPLPMELLRTRADPGSITGSATGTAPCTARDPHRRSPGPGADTGGTPA